MSKRSWIVVLDRLASIAAVRSELREVPFALTDGPRPAAGDRVIVMALPAATLVGMATVARVGEDGTLHLRDRSRAPVGHAVDPYSLRPLPLFAVERPRERLVALAGGVLAIGEHDGVRVGSAIRAQALSFGPLPSRPIHDRPR